MIILKVNRYYELTGVRLVGPNCPGLITPASAKSVFLPGNIVKKEVSE